jgi:tetratricopeptide (TPR) repeat protein
MGHYLRYKSGALYALGALETYRDGDGAVRTAERLDALENPLAQMSADRLRMMYYANQGNLALHEHYRQRVEMHAIQQGSAWQVEAWAPSAGIMVHLRTYDVMGMKRDMEQVLQLSKGIPSLEIYNQRAWGTYQMLRGQPAEALAALEACTRESPGATVGWARAHGALARAYSSLGRHADARSVCLSALARMREEDLLFPAMNLIVETELASAEAALGNVELAAAQLDDLLQKHTPYHGPLTLGLLHETRAQVAKLAGDSEVFQRHIRRMEHWYRSTSVPTLIARCEQLRTKNAGASAFYTPDPSEDVVTTLQNGGNAAIAAEKLSDVEAPPSAALEQTSRIANSRLSDPAPRP